MKPKLHRSPVIAALIAMIGGCSSNSAGRSNGSGGGGGTGSGGVSASGGSATTGGTTGSGGAGASGGTTSPGGQTGSGGSTLGSGGTSASGGRSGSGGASASGGVTASGGQTGQGGTGTSRTTGTGGQTGAGGTTPTGGTTGAGGRTSSGGTTGSGGGTGSGGPTTVRDGAAPDGPLDSAMEVGSGGFDPCPATGNCKILPLGDSITAGAGAQPGDGGGYRVELFTKAVSDSKHITFVGSLSSGPSTVAGQTFPQNHEGHIGWKIDQVSGIATTSQALKDSPPIVLLFIGTNDEGYASSEAGASDRLGTLIDKIVAALPNSLLVVSSIYPFPGCKDTNYTPTQCAANVATYDAAIPGVIKQRADQGKHVIFVDMSTPPSDALSTDGVHPNDTVGYPWMGDTWYATIKSYLH